MLILELLVYSMAIFIFGGQTEREQGRKREIN